MAVFPLVSTMRHGSTYLHQEGQALEQLAEGQEAVLAGLERDAVRRLVALLELLHCGPGRLPRRAPSSVALPRGRPHQQRQQLGGERPQGLPVDQLHLAALRPIRQLRGGRWHRFISRCCGMMPRSWCRQRPCVIYREKHKVLQ